MTSGISSVHGHSNTMRFRPVVAERSLVPLNTAFKSTVGDVLHVNQTLRAGGGLTRH